MTLFTIWLVALAVFVALLALPLAVAPLRRALVSRPLLAKFRKVMPPMSQTEREALEAGTVGWDGELFRGRPAWEELLASSGVFTDVHSRRSVPHEHVLDHPGILDNLRSTSWIANRDDREEVVAELGALVPDATYAVPSEANVIWARRA